jgi:hypothetical protein
MWGNAYYTVEWDSASSSREWSTDSFDADSFFGDGFDSDEEEEEEDSYEVKGGWGPVCECSVQTGFAGSSCKEVCQYYTPPGTPKSKCVSLV